MTKTVTCENSETGFGSLRIVNGVDRLIYISDTDMEEGHRLHSIEYTIYIQIIYRYLLTFAIWRLSLNFIPVYYLLVLYWSQRGYFFFEVQSCMLLFSSISQINPITLYTWLFLVPSSKQVVDQEESKTILWSSKKVRWTSSITSWFKGYLFLDTLESALLLLLRWNYFAVSYKTSQYLESLHLRRVDSLLYVPVAGPILLSLKGVWGLTQ
jgi:hypothetical protein